MLTPKEISILFEVQINTLYNWRKTKPKLYAYLQNADYNSEINNEINILLESYGKTISKNFTISEIDFLIKSDYELITIDEVNQYQDCFIKSNYKLLATNHKLILNIYDKIKDLNIIDKYLLYKKVYKVRQVGHEDRQTYFSEFLGKGK